MFVSTESLSGSFSEFKLVGPCLVTNVRCFYPITVITLFQYYGSLSEYVFSRVLSSQDNNSTGNASVALRHPTGTISTILLIWDQRPPWPCYKTRPLSFVRLRTVPGRCLSSVFFDNYQYRTLSTAARSLREELCSSIRYPNAHHARFRFI